MTPRTRVGQGNVGSDAKTKESLPLLSSEVWPATRARASRQPQPRIGSALEFSENAKTSYHLSVPEFSSLAKELFCPATLVFPLGQQPMTTQSGQIRMASSSPCCQQRDT